MSEYVPTTGGVEAYYCTAKQEATGVRDHSHHDEFRAWLAARDAEVAAKAYERAILDVGLNPDLANQLLDTNPYRKAVQS